MYLCIDTTTSQSGVTLIGDKTYHKTLDPQSASEQLMGAIDELILKSGPLKESGLQKLEGIFVIKGPGSYTGLRVGIAIANQFAHQLKIPIIGLKTDEWWSNRTDEKDFIYLQTMNKSEMYTDGKIIQIDKLSGTKKWLGEISDQHRNKLPSGFKEINNLKSPEETWAKVIEKNCKLQTTSYHLIEPFYGKKPTITKSKKKLSI